MLSFEKFRDFMESKRVGFVRVYISNSKMFLEGCTFQKETIFIEIPVSMFHIVEIPRELLTEKIVHPEIATNENSISYGCNLKSVVDNYSEGLFKNKHVSRLISQLVRLSKCSSQLSLCILTNNYFLASGKKVSVYMCGTIQNPSRFYPLVHINSIIEDMDIVPDFDKYIRTSIRACLDLYKKTYMEYIESSTRSISTLSKHVEQCAKYDTQLRDLRLALDKVLKERDVFISQRQSSRDAVQRSIISQALEETNAVIVDLQAKTLAHDTKTRDLYLKIESVLFENTLFMETAMGNII